MIRSSPVRLLAAGACALLLAACATTGAPPPNAQVAPYREQLELDGRLFVNFEKDGKPDTLSVKFNWLQQGPRVDVSLATPLGQTVARISVTPQAATLTQANRAPLTAPDIDGLTQEALGWPLPVSGLRDWLQGYASGADGRRFAASPANNSVLTADGWQLSFVTWQDAAPGAANPRPRRIDATRAAGAHGGPLAIRIVLEDQG